MSRTIRSARVTAHGEKTVFRFIGGRVTARPLSVGVSPHPAPDSPEPERDEATGDQIRRLAYRKWEAAGSPPGDGVAFWLEAECELAAR